MMENLEWYWEYHKVIEEDRNRRISNFDGVSSKVMDLGIDRILKDCELYITLFGLSIAGLSFLYADIENVYLKILFIVNIVLISVGIVWSFILKNEISRNIEEYYLRMAHILKEEIDELDADNPPKEAGKLLKKWLDESHRLLMIKGEKLDNSLKEYKVIEGRHLRQKHYIFRLYIISCVVFIALLIIPFFLKS